MTAALLVQRDGASIHWRIDGEPARPVLMFGNSLGTDQSVWDGVLPGLLPHFRVLRFDHRGHGASGLAPATHGRDYTVELLARDALAVADAAGARRFHYCGLSIGGMVGLWLGRHAPERLHRLVLSNTAAQPPAAAAWDERIAAVRAGGMASLVDSTMQRWFTPAFMARGGPLLARTRAVFLDVDPVGYVGCAAAIRDMDLRDALPAIRTPTLVLTGDADPATPSALGQEIAAAIPGAAWTELPGAHIPHLEHPDAYVAALTQFLLPRQRA